MLLCPEEVLNYSGFCKFIISVRGASCDYSPRAPESSCAAGCDCGALAEWWLTNDRSIPGAKPVAVQFHPSQIRRGLARDQFWALTMRSRRLTACSTLRPMFAMFVTRSFATAIQHPWWMNDYEALVKWHWQGKRGLRENLSHCHFVVLHPMWTGLVSIQSLSYFPRAKMFGKHCCIWNYCKLKCNGYIAAHF